MNTFGCVANTMKLRSGVYFDLNDPKPNQFTLADIAGALSKICRFGGQINWWYSVAEHSVHCAALAMKDGQSKWTCQAVLLHDAAEAFLGDVIKPLKIMLPEYSEIEKRVERVIAAKFRVDFEAHKEVIREIDHAMLIAERRKLFGSDGVVWEGEYSVRLVPLFPENWTYARAEIEFMDTARFLGITEHGATP